MHTAIPAVSKLRLCLYNKMMGDYAVINGARNGQGIAACFALFLQKTGRCIGWPG